jgi:periplasmic protein TonB
MQSETRETVNGSRDGSVARASFAVVGGAAYDDPMSKVLGLDAKTSGLGAWFGFTSGSTALLAGLMALATFVAWMHTANARSVSDAPEEIEVMKEDSPPPPPPQPEAKPEPAAPPPRALPHEAPPPPSTPAQAAKVVTALPDPDEPVDLTGNTIVQGNADSFAGGYTSSSGTNTQAVRALPSPTGMVGGTGPVNAAPAGPDRTRPASLSGSHDWNAPFPQEADAVQMDEAYVTLEIDVRADGSAAAVRVLKDPGYGFGREARRYALTQRYTTALDHDGNAIAGKIGPIRVHFSR